MNPKLKHLKDKPKTLKPQILINLSPKSYISGAVGGAN